jgi:hypothetical protein
MRSALAQNCHGIMSTIGAEALEQEKVKNHLPGKPSSSNEDGYHLCLGLGIHPDKEYFMYGLVKQC